MAKTVDFAQPLCDVYGDPLPETYADGALTDRLLVVCEKCGVSTPHHEMKQRPLTLGSVCVTSLISSKDRQLPEEEVVRRMSLAQRIVGKTRGQWATIGFEDAGEITSIKEAVGQAPQGWSISVRAAVIEALKV